MLRSVRAGRSFLKHALSADLLFMIGAAFVHVGLAFLAIGGVHCLCSLVSRVSDAALALAPAQTVLCTIVFNGTVPIPPATAVNYVPWDMVGFM